MGQKIVNPSVEPWKIQRVLMLKSPPEVTNITHACALLAKSYGVSQETLRCYASTGVPARSKIAKKILRDFKEMEDENYGIDIKITEAEKQLLNSLEALIEAFSDSQKLLTQIKKSIREKIEVANDRR